MNQTALAAVLATALLPLGSRAEPYRPLPRLAAEEVDRRADDQPPVPPPPPSDDEGIAATPAQPERGVAPAPLDPPVPPRPAAPPRDDGPVPPAPPPLAAEPAQPARPAAAPAPGTPRAPTMETFRAALSPFGTWERWSGYGWVWRPEVAADWKPYHDGQWIWTERGWSWSSEEPWGWATYHYGRWTYDASNGWAWIPGFEWAPAWVAWRMDGAVVGWAPIFSGQSSWAIDHPSARFWTFMPRERFKTGVPVARAAYAPRHFDVLWTRFAGRVQRPAPQR